MKISGIAAQAVQLKVAELFHKQAQIRANRPAVVYGERTITFAELDQRTTQLANALVSAGVGHGDRVAVLSQNDPVFLDVFMAAAKIGAIVATQNWRLSGAELKHCFDLVQPALTFVSGRFADALQTATGGTYPSVRIGSEYDAFLKGGSNEALTDVVDAEDGMLIVYTSGTTGLPKGALISQRALIARAQQYCTEFGIDPEDTFFAYSPMFHIASADLAIATLIIGGTVHVADGLDYPLMRRLLVEEKLSNLIFFPGMVGPVLEELAKMEQPVRSLKKFGALADLFPAHEIAAMTTAMNKEYCNTYASTETGMAPGCGGRIPIGHVPKTYSKTESNFCLVRLIGEDGKEAPVGAKGELVMRGPTLFSGYWGNNDATQEAFAGGWYHTGDVFRRNADGTLDYIDRMKYLVKSGGENIYPAEIERVVLQDKGVVEALVVRRPDPKWGEVPVLVVTVTGQGVTEQSLIDRCLDNLARYKCPKGVFFVPADFWPRNNTGKIVRREVEQWVLKQSREASPTS
ncbi:AMP-binding protein [Pseudophaeobacter sp.]|jgi:fatty-acyl-CoA synthase|uniref:class I adenylate-forming enzyme family protein n=1 Tax=Pseudophaeobacter sp. TaxID=1971739 RepID=UPI0032D99593